MSELLLNEGINILPMPSNGRRYYILFTNSQGMASLSLLPYSANRPSEIPEGFNWKPGVGGLWLNYDVPSHEATPQSCTRIVRRMMEFANTIDGGVNVRHHLALDVGKLDDRGDCEAS